jgi:hypothetical protein
MLPYKAIVVTGISELPPYELEKGDSQLEMMVNYLQKQGYKTVIGSERISIAYFNPSERQPNLCFKFDEAGSLIQEPTNDRLVVQVLPYLHREQHETVS